MATGSSLTQNHSRSQSEIQGDLHKVRCTINDVWEIGSRVGRNQTTVMQICDHWMQEGTADRRVRSHPPQCTTSREERQIVRMTVTDRSVTSRTVAQHIESVTHHSVSARTIRRRLQQSGQSIAWSTLDVEPQTSPPPMVR
ncbi:transposable element Tcb1 transposase [Trichonephila clavipes]|nr:transposable element Tcb1 transposase [Trichonephila clavipes]